MRAVLTFHSIDNKNSVISYPVTAFEKLLATLSDKKIPIVTLDTLIKPETNIGVALTFDDGMQSVLNNALPVIREHQANAHIYITTSAVGTDIPWPREANTQYQMLSWDDIDQLYENGIYIENHTCSHPDFRTLSKSQITDECDKADELIEKQLGRKPKHFAYPYGYHNSQARDLMRKRYATSVTTELKPLSDSFDAAALPRIDSYYLQSDWSIHNLDSLLMKGYIAIRNTLRNIKGSQNKANYD